MTVDECKQKCDSTDGCTGVTIGLSDQNGKYPCYRRSDIEIDKCDHGTTFDTHVKAEWFPAWGFNCYGYYHRGEWTSCGTKSLRKCRK